MQDLVELATSEPPPLRHDADRILAAGRGVQRRRRMAMTAAGVAVLGIVAAAAVAVPAVRTKDAGLPQQPAEAAQPVPATAEPFTFTFDGYRVGKLQVSRPVDVSTAYQLASVYADGLTSNDTASGDVEQPQPQRRGRTLWAYLTVYRAGAYDPSKLTGAQQVTVGGRPGLEVNAPLYSWAATRTLAWQYNTGAWAVINASSDDAAFPSAKDLRDLAAGLRAAPAVAARTPVTLAYLPAGYRLQEASMHAMTGLNGIATAREGDFAGLLFSNPALPTTGLSTPFGGVDGAGPAGSFVVYVVPAANSNQRPTSDVSCGDGFCNRWFDGVDVQVSSEGRLSDGEMRRILAGVTLADVRNDGAWTVATAATP